jgi:hypothetical protein
MDLVRRVARVNGECCYRTTFDDPRNQWVNECDGIAFVALTTFLPRKSDSL